MILPTLHRPTLHTKVIRRGTALLVMTTMLTACHLVGPAYEPPSSPQQPGTSQPAPGTPPGQPAPSSPSSTQPAPKQFRLSPASSSLVAQARKQAAAGDFATATATVERALRIEPDNPLLWIELGQVHLTEGNAPQADSMGRKALALATGDPSAQAAAWHLIAEALRARGRNQEASEAEQRAAGLAPR